MENNSSLERLVKRSLQTIALGTLFLTSDAPAYHTVPKGSFDKVFSVKSYKEGKICHRDLSFAVIHYYKQDYGKTPSAEDLKNDELILRVVQGAIDEDNIVAGEGMRFVQHFYNPNRDEKHDGVEIPSFNLNDGSKDALTKARELWQSSINLYKQNNKKEAYYTLGRVLHLFEDMGCPEHVYLIYHGPRIVQVACKFEGEENSKLYDILSEAFKKIASKINPEKDIDWEKCVTAEISSSYEDYCNETSMPKTFQVPNIKLDYSTSEDPLGDLFKDMANDSLNPTPGNFKFVRPFFERNFRIGETGNGSYVSENGVVSKADCKWIADYLVPRIMTRGTVLLKTWNDQIIK